MKDHQSKINASMLVDTTSPNYQQNEHPEDGKWNMNANIEA